MIVGAGDEPCVVLAVGAREHQGTPAWGAYPVEAAAQRHGAGVDQETSDELGGVRERAASQACGVQGGVASALALALRVGEHRAGCFEIVRVHEDLARAVGGEALEGRVRRLGHAVTAIEAVRAEQPAHDVGLDLAGNGGDNDAFVHRRRLLHELERVRV